MNGTPPSVHAETLIASAQALGNEIVRLRALNREMLAALKVAEDAIAQLSCDCLDERDQPVRTQILAAIAAAEGRDS